MGRRPSDGEAVTRSMDDRADRADGGLSLLVTVMGLFVSALLVLLVLKATVTSDSKSSPSTPSLPAVADAAQAQQNLSAALTTAEQAGTTGQGGLDAAAMQSIDPSLTFTSGASTDPHTVSVTPAPDGSSVALVARSTDGICWAVWWSPTSGSFYGAQTGQASCLAPTLTARPAAAPVTSTAFGWQGGSFPAA